jgi:hypothetical protein
MTHGPSRRPARIPNRSARGPRKPGAPSTAGWRRAAAGAGLGLVLLVVVLLAWGQQSRRAPAARPGPGGRPAFEAPGESVRVAVALGRYNQALPFARRIVALQQEHGPVPAKVRLGLASVLGDAASETGAHGPVARSSFERVRLIREAVVEMERARAEATLPDERAKVLIAEGTLLGSWGFSMDALAAFNTAVKADPRNPATLLRWQSYMTLVREISGAPPAGASRSRP